MRATEIFARVMIIISSLIVIAYLATSIVQATNDHEIILTVTEKERIQHRGSSEYLLFCKDEDGATHVIRNSDTLWRWKWNSSDIYGDIETGGTYRFTLSGYRIPIMSAYENVMAYERIGD